MIEVRLSVEDKNILKFVNFDEADKGILRLKSPRDSHVFEEGIKIGLRYPIKFETFINRNHAVGMVFIDNTLMLSSKGSIQLTNYGIKDGIDGTLDFFNPHFSMIKDLDYFKGQKFLRNDSVIFIRFVSDHYHKLLLQRDIEGVKSEDIDIRVFVNGKFKPRNDYQLISTGYEIIDKPYLRSSEFYDLEFISFDDNNIDDNGVNLPSPRNKTVKEFKEVRYSSKLY